MPEPAPSSLVAPAQPIKGRVFLASGESGLRAFSRDGITWTHMQTAREGTLLDRACFAGGRCVAAGRLGGERTAFVTADGLTWTQTKLDGRPCVTRVEVLYAEQNHFHLVVNEDGEKPGVLRSADGIKWEPRKPVLDNPKVLRHDAHLRRGVLGADGQLVVIRDYGARLSRKAVGDQWQAVARQTPAIDRWHPLETGSQVSASHPGARSRPAGLMQSCSLRRDSRCSPVSCRRRVAALMPLCQSRSAWSGVRFIRN